MLSVKNGFDSDALDADAFEADGFDWDGLDWGWLIAASGLADFWANAGAPVEASATARASARGCFIVTTSRW
ncbi:hypothetical protein GCM10007067_03380 [Lysobacter bugurensis]|uniref:Uncharacterized protein n=1 Tax=Cognatilysobacter bugurensis TaxID=543356 RepID=A0A918STW0_9GAMM|nr:hypothetical protein GCM10007067_03380 [Lysobacter bugurensis]